MRTSEILHVYVGGQQIRTTAEHPFYVAGHGWVRAGELAAGDMLLGHDGQCMAVGGVERTAQLATVYNLTVAEDHTYFVGSPEWGFSAWVHNTYTARAGANGLWEIVDDAGDVVQSGFKTEKEAIDEAARLTQRQAELAGGVASALRAGVGAVVEPTLRSWKNHGSRLYSDLKNEFGLPISFKYTDPNARALVAREYQKLIENGTLKYLGFANDVHGSYHVYEYGANLYLFGHDGALISRWAPGSQGRAITRIRASLGR